MVLSDEQINEIVDYIRGTCTSLDQAIYDITNNELDMLDQVANWRELCDAVDLSQFLCDNCGWWSEASEASEGVCSDCRYEEDE
jgi:hypothetical protein